MNDLKRRDILQSNQRLLNGEKDYDRLKSLKWTQMQHQETSQLAKEFLDPNMYESYSKELIERGTPSLDEIQTLISEGRTFVRYLLDSEAYSELGLVAENLQDGRISQAHLRLKFLQKYGNDCPDITRIKFLLECHAFAIQFSSTYLDAVRDQYVKKL